jgi:methyl-accepting chemotaxis protein
MDYAIPIGQLAWFIVFLLAIGAGIYLILTLRNLNGLIRDVGALVHKNREHLDRSAADLPVITANAVVISQELRTQVTDMGDSLDQVSDSVTDTAETVHKTAEEVSTYAFLISDVIKAGVDLFSSGDRRR